ncbi:30S ribosomal protein S6 [Desulfospira joergensenii]|uniref:30S ribosomal protein S6 n=1 Tax=Desulfospira joergensenii TaxID=53329 RepID=UPI0003B5275E|nr:30S ribosomal protein S6 [Desulfospira joergensenii]
MRKYETVFISDPDLQEKARTELFDKVRNIIAKENGILLDFDEWGNKKLAYEIRKKIRGHYACITYGGTGDLVSELERNFRLSDDIMKFMTILLSDDVTAESLAQEVEEAEKAAQASAESAAKAEEARQAEALEKAAEEEKPADEAEEEPEAEAEEAKETKEVEADAEEAEKAEEEQN